MKLFNRSFLKVFFTAILISFIGPASAYTANVTIRWDANDPAPEGYRVYSREGSQSYTYDSPIWEDNLTTCSLTGLAEGVTYFYVVRAFDGEVESADSEEVSYTPPVVIPNQPPVADAGQDQTVYEAVQVTLDGSGSYDPDGNIVVYQWTQTGGAGVSISGAANSQASFTAPVVDLDGDVLIFRLAVTDDDGSTSVSTASVGVLKSPNTDVDADSIPDVQDLFPNDPSEWADSDADGTGDNEDPDDDNDGMPDLWEQAYGLDPVSDDAQDDEDGDGISNLDEYHAGSDPLVAPIIINQPPIALAGGDQVVDEGDLVLLDGSESTDTDGQISTVEWKQTEGTLVMLSDSDMLATTFTAPAVGAEGSILVFSLTVTDEDGSSAVSTCAVTVIKLVNDDDDGDDDDTPTAASNLLPVADAGSDMTVKEGDGVVLNGNGSHDPDGEIVAYLWEQTQGALVSLSSPTNTFTSFTAPAVGSDGELLAFQLTVTDDAAATAFSACSVYVLKNLTSDSDNDGVADDLDTFPNDPTEWTDNDDDGIGDNLDADDDNDGMTDAWEILSGLNPMEPDANEDPDDGAVDDIYLDPSDTDLLVPENTDGYTDPVSAPANTAPDVPVIDTASPAVRVGLTPVLVSGDYCDTDNDGHYQSWWQISTETDFTTLVLDDKSEIQLTAYTVGEMILDIDTAYYWRVKYIDARNGTSGWSPTATFTTIDAESSDDTDINGIPDAQEVDSSVDLNENGIFDQFENSILCVATVEGEALVGVETISDNVALVSIKSLPTDTIPDQSVKVAFGLIGFKLYLPSGVKTAIVNLHFSEKVPNDALLYKYKADSGWEVVENATIDVNGRRLTLIVEDGGKDDEDGVENGVIVDPSGIAFAEADPSYSDSVSTEAVSSPGGGGGGCFILTGMNGVATGK